MRNIICFLFVTSLLFITGCDVTKVDFVGNADLDTYEFNDVNKDKVYSLKIYNINLVNDAIDIEFVEGSTSYIKIITDKNILDTIEITNNYGVIKVFGDRSYSYDSTDFKIEICNVKLFKYDLEGSYSIIDDIGNYDNSLEIHTAGFVSVNLNLEKVSEKIKISGDGINEIVMHSVNAKTINLKSGGTSNFRAEGTCENLTVDTDGLSTLLLKDLVVKSADLKMNGSSYSSFNVTDNLVINVSGFGNIEYYGNPKSENIKKDGFVTIIKK